MSDETTGKPPEQKQGRYPNKFSVEFGDGCGTNPFISTLQLIVRGEFSRAKIASRPQGTRTPGELIQRIPDPMPGARMEIDCRRKHFKLYDPFSEPAGRKVLDQYNGVAKRNPGRGLVEYEPFETIEGDLDDDKLKTLLYELIKKRESGHMRVISGDLPDKEQVDAMPGFELYDPSNTGQNKPRYKKDLQAWLNRMEAAAVI